METIVILAAGAALLLTCVMLLGASRTRRAPLRLPQEEAIAGDDEEARIAAIRPVPPGPIDRDAPVLDLEPIKPEEPETPGRRDDAR